MGCSGCEIHRAIHGVTKVSKARPRDEPIPSSSKRVVDDRVRAPVIDEQRDRAIPLLVSKLDSSNDSGIA